jgi:TolB-like protein
VAKTGEGGAASIAVLPFVNQSGDPKRDYFSDGLTEDIINALAPVLECARRRAQRGAGLQGPQRTPEEVSRDLGVRYLLQGSVRESEGKVRVGVELSDAMKGTLLWSDRYDGGGKEVFEIQDRIVHNIVGALAVKVTSLEQQRSASKAPDSMEAYDLVLRARGLMQHIERGTNREARGLAAQAIKLSPGYAEAHVVAAEAELQRAAFGFVRGRAVERPAAPRRWPAAPLAIDDPGRMRAPMRSSGRCSASPAASRTPSPKWTRRSSSTRATPGRAALRADALLWIGRLEESIAEAETARRFDPRIRGEVNFDLNDGLLPQLALSRRTDSGRAPARAHPGRILRPRHARGHARADGQPRRGA